jgi:hypothetical protein
MNFQLTENVHVILPQAALTTIFDECDRFEHDETGGRAVGTFKELGGKLALCVTGIIESGPKAQRTAVSFFQDGEYQERIFRQIESRHPEIEHLGNWHTHHVNGLPKLSGGDIDTYYRTVNHHNHNTSFFYALLVTAKHRTSDPLRRYSIKHYVFRRGDERVYEIPRRQVEIVESPLVWPTSVAHTGHETSSDPADLGVQPGRVYDRDILAELYQGFRSFASKELGFYWRGPLELLDGSKVQVVLLEDSKAPGPSYSVALREPPEVLKGIADELGTREFSSARKALVTTERVCNRTLYQHRCDTVETKTLN